MSDEYSIEDFANELAQMEEDGLISFTPTEDGNDFTVTMTPLGDLIYELECDEDGIEYI